MLKRIWNWLTHNRRLTEKPVLSKPEFTPGRQFPVFNVLSIPPTPSGNCSHDWEIVKRETISEILEHASCPVSISTILSSSYKLPEAASVFVCVKCKLVDDQIIQLEQKLREQWQYQVDRQERAQLIYNEYLNTKQSINSGGLSVVE